eukprot:169061_1
MGLCAAKENQKNDAENAKIENQTSDVEDEKIQNQKHVFDTNDMKQSVNKHQQIMNQMHIQFDLAIFEQQHNECESIKNCASIKRLILASKYFSLLDIINNISNRDVFSNFINEVYHRLLDDYIHLVNKHGHDLNEIDLSSIECNDMKSCQFTSRHQKQKADDNKLEPELNFYKQVMDSFHFFVSHLYHCGLRTISNNDDDDDEIENEDEYFDKVFYRLNKQIKQ